MDGNFERKTVFLVDDLETLRVITDPLRLQILEMLAPKPQTVNQVAKKMGHAASRLYYHFNMLEKLGMIGVYQTRMVNNLVEKLYWLTAEDIEIDKGLMDFSQSDVQESLAGLIASSLEFVQADMLRSIQARTYHLEQGAKPIPRDIILQSTRKRLSDETYEQFKTKLRALLKEFSELPEETRKGDDVNFFSLACYMYPNFYYEEDETEREDEIE